MGIIQAGTEQACLQSERSVCREGLGGVPYLFFQAPPDQMRLVLNLKDMSHSLHLGSKNQTAFFPRHTSSLIIHTQNSGNGINAQGRIESNMLSHSYISSAMRIAVKSCVAGKANSYPLKGCCLTNSSILNVPVTRFLESHTGRTNVLSSNGYTELQQHLG